MTMNFDDWYIAFYLFQAVSGIVDTFDKNRKPELIYFEKN